MPVFVDTVIARVVSHQTVCSPHQLCTLRLFSFSSHLKWLHCFCFSPLAAVTLIRCTLIGTHNLSLAVYFSKELPVWRLQPLLFLLINHKSRVLLHFMGVVLMSSGEYNDMKDNLKKLKWALCPKTFKQRCIICHSRQPEHFFWKELLYKPMIIYNYMPFTQPDDSLLLCSWNRKT